MFVHTVLVCEGVTTLYLIELLTTSPLIETRQTLITATCHICFLFLCYCCTSCNILVHWIWFCVLPLREMCISSSFLLPQHMMKVWFSSPSLLPSVLILDSLFVLGSEELYICCEHYFARYTNAKCHTCQHRKQTSASSTCRVKPGNISCLSCIIKLFLAY